MQSGLIVTASLTFGLALSGCDWREYGPPPIDPVRVEDNGGTQAQQNFRGPVASGIPDAASTFMARYKNAVANAGTSTDTQTAKLFLEAGIALSDDLCASWFQALGQAQVRVNTQKDFAGNLGALTAVLLSVTGAPTAAVGGIAAGTNFSVKTLDSELANYIVAPDVGIVERAVIGERNMMASDILSQNLGFYQSYSKLVNYDNLCSHNEVKRIVDASVAKTAATANGATTTSGYYNTLVSTVLPQLKALFPDGVTLDDGALTALYALVVKKDALTDAQKTQYQKTLAADKLMDNNGNLLLKITVPTTATQTDKTAATKAATSKLAELLSTINAAGDLDAEMNADAKAGTKPADKS